MTEDITLRRRQMHFIDTYVANRMADGVHYPKKDLQDAHKAWKTYIAVEMPNRKEKVCSTCKGEGGVWPECPDCRRVYPPPELTDIPGVGTVSVLEELGMDEAYDRLVEKGVIEQAPKQLMNVGVFEPIDPVEQTRKLAQPSPEQMETAHSKLLGDKQPSTEDSIKKAIEAGIEAALHNVWVDRGDEKVSRAEDSEIYEYALGLLEDT